MNAEPVKASVQDQMLWIELRDGRTIGTPIDWYPFLDDVPPEQMNQIRLKWNAIWWDSLDEGLSIEGMLLGVNPRHEQRHVTLDESDLVEVS